ncbi:MAG: hypothetical protein ACE5EK_09210 [Nitrospinales bacterium]
MEENNKVRNEKTLEIYRLLKINLQDFPSPFDPQILGEEYKNFTIYKSENYDFTTNSSSFPPPSQIS